MVAAVLAGLLVGALVLAGYLWFAADRWRGAAQAWEDQARGQAAEVARLGAELEAANGELTSAREQLSTATERITDLADEKARLGDENVVAQQYLDYQRRVSDAAGVVAEALGRCTSGQAQLIEYLRTPERYDAAELEEFRGQVAELCASATEANAALQQELEQ
jgi:chromosome segregation ATPase